MFNAHILNDGRERTADVALETMLDFEGLLLSPNVIKGLHNAGFTRPSPIQLQAIPYAKIGLDLICQAKSGTGKTCVFAVCALEMVKVKHAAVQVLVLAPTREIAHQILGVLTTLGSGTKGLQCCLFIGGTQLEDDLESLKLCHVAVGTPGRVRYLIEKCELATDSIRLFVLDEADKLLEEGSFQEQINWIYSTLPKDKQVLALSATYPESLATHLNSYMQDPYHVRINVDDLTLKGVKQYVTKTMFHPLPAKAFEEKCKRLIDIITKIPFQQCMVFSNFQKGAENLSKRLCKEGWPCTFIAGSQIQTARLRAMNQLRNYHCRILITTDLTARGIDCDKVDLVINLDLPWETETYLHRVGRAGRFGSLGVAISILSDGEEVKKLIEIGKEVGNPILRLKEDFTMDDVLDEDIVEIDSGMINEKKLVGADIDSELLAVPSSEAADTMNGSNGHPIDFTNDEVPNHDENETHNMGICDLSKAPRSNDTICPDSNDTVPQLCAPDAEVSNGVIECTNTELDMNSKADVPEHSEKSSDRVLADVPASSISAKPLPKYLALSRKLKSDASKEKLLKSQKHEPTCPIKMVEPEAVFSTEKREVKTKLNDVSSSVDTSSITEEHRTESLVCHEVESKERENLQQDNDVDQCEKEILTFSDGLPRNSNDSALFISSGALKNKSVGRDGGAEEGGGEEGGGGGGRGGGRGGGKKIPFNPMSVNLHLLNLNGSSAPSVPCGGAEKKASDNPVMAPVTKTKMNTSGKKEKKDVIFRRSEQTVDEDDNGFYAGFFLGSPVHGGDEVEEVGGLSDDSNSVNCSLIDKVQYNYSTQESTVYNPSELSCVSSKNSKDGVCERDTNQQHKRGQSSHTVNGGKYVSGFGICSNPDSDSNSDSDAESDASSSSSDLNCPSELAYTSEVYYSSQSVQQTFQYDKSVCSGSTESSCSTDSTVFARWNYDSQKPFQQHQRQQKQQQQKQHHHQQHQHHYTQQQRRQQQHQHYRQQQRQQKQHQQQQQQQQQRQQRHLQQPQPQPQPQPPPQPQLQPQLQQQPTYCYHCGASVRKWNQELFNAYFFKSYRDHVEALSSVHYWNDGWCTEL